MIIIDVHAYHEVTDDHREKEERDADDSGAEHTVPHGLDPLAAQDAEDDHERVEEVGEIPARHGGKIFLGVVDAVQLHAHDGEYEDDDGQHDTQVAQCSHRTTDDTNEKVQRRPRLGQLEHAQLTTAHDRLRSVSVGVLRARAVVWVNSPGRSQLNRSASQRSVYAFMIQIFNLQLLEVSPDDDDDDDEPMKSVFAERANDMARPLANSSVSVYDGMRTEVGSCVAVPAASNCVGGPATGKLREPL